MCAQSWQQLVFATSMSSRRQPCCRKSRVWFGYYRLLLGRPQKSFYDKDGFGVFRSMEVSGLASPKQLEALSDYCKAMSLALADLVRQLAPTVTMDDIRELPLLILGSQFQGGANNVIGQQAVREVFAAVVELVEPHIVQNHNQSATVRNASGRVVRITRASDPDLRIEEQFDGNQFHNKVAIEVKGGTDASNAHNRAGEAEKSHQKAKDSHYELCWTVIALRGVDSNKLRTESPTTQRWFDIAEVLARSGASWEDFRQRIAGAVGIGL
jgi:hypothetical protein